MLPRLYPTPFARLWNPVMARVYGGWLPEDLDGLTHREIHMVVEDLKALAG